VQAGASAGGGERGGLSRAIIQNRLGSTTGLANGVQLPRGGSGLVVGDLNISHNQLAPATLIAAKWGRIASTTYAKVPAEPCSLRCELQPVYYESFLSDLDAALGAGRFEFRVDVSPAVFLVDVGSANEAAHGHRQGNVPPAPFGGGAQADGGSSGTQATGEDGGASDTDGADDEAAGGRGGAMLSLADVSRSGACGELDDTAASKLRRRKRRKARKIMSEDDVRRGELRLAMEEGKVKANEQLLDLADQGNDYAIQRLMRKGWLIKYDPHPLYMQLAEKARAAKLESRAANLATDDSPGRQEREIGDDGSDEEGGRDGRPRRRNQAAQQPSSSARKPEVFVLPDINVVDLEGNTPLMRAARHGMIDACIALLREGADFRRKNARGQTAYDLAKAESNMASLALQMGVPGAPERKRRAAKLVQLLDNRTVLGCAQKGDLRRLQFLVDEQGHPVNASNQYGMTPLHFAVIRRDVAMIRFLSERGASITARNNLGQTPVSIVLDAVGDVLQARLLEALNAGDAIRAAQEQQRLNAQREGEELAAEERKMVAELKTFTRGTTAARAVQAAFPYAVARPPAFGPPPGSAPIDASEITTVRGTLPASKQYNKRPPTALTSLVPASVSGGALPAGAKGSAATSSQLLGTSRQSVPLQDNGALVESWNRHGKFIPYPALPFRLALPAKTQ